MPAIKRDKLKPLGYQDIPKDGRVREFSSKTPLIRTAGMVRLVCPICFIDFQKPYAWVKRVENSYCGRGCANEAKKIRIEKPCIVCGKVMSLTPTYFKRIVTCSRVCKSVKTRKSNGRNYRSSYAYEEAALKIMKESICAYCGVTHGPWTVRNIKVNDCERELKADIDTAFLLCRHCALLEAGERAKEHNPNHIKHKQRIKEHASEYSSILSTPEVD